jgi:anti-anti-sigma factor
MEGNDRPVINSSVSSHRFFDTMGVSFFDTMGVGFFDTMGVGFRLQPVRHHQKRQRFTEGSTMAISSRTPEGLPISCPVCGSHLKIEPSDPADDAPCHRCGHLLWFTWEDRGDVEVFRPTARVLSRESLDSFLDSVAIRPGVQLVLDLSDVRFFSSSVLAQLINLKKRVARVGGRVRIQHVYCDLLEVFRITHLDHVFDVEA